MDGRPCTIQPDVNQVTARAPASIRLSRYPAPGLFDFGGSQTLLLYYDICSIDLFATTDARAARDAAPSGCHIRYALPKVTQQVTAQTNLVDQYHVLFDYFVDPLFLYFMCHSDAKLQFACCLRASE